MRNVFEELTLNTEYLDLIPKYVTQHFPSTGIMDQSEIMSENNNQSEGRFVAGEIALVEWEDGAVYYCVIHTVRICLYYSYYYL